MSKSPILGTAYQARSRNLAYQQCINLYLESAQTKEGHAPAALMGCPGLSLEFTVEHGPIRAMKVWNGLRYVITGNAVVRINANGSGTELGTIATSTGTAYIVANNTQIGFFDSTGMWVWTPGSSSYAPVTLPYAGTVGMPTFQDTFCLLTQPGTNVIWQSNSNDLTTWGALNFTTEDGNAQNVVGLQALHDQVIVFKDYSICFYVNAGLVGFAYQRLSGVFPAIGCMTPASIAVVSDNAFWLGQTANGGPKLYRLEGYQPIVISTYAIDEQLTAYSLVTDAYGFGYVQQGHSFYIVSFPTGNTTWCYDLTESSNLRIPVWHQRAQFANGAFGLYSGSCTCQVGGTIYMGDYANGNVYILDLTVYRDNGVPRKWLRSWRALPETAYQISKVNYLNLQMETGVTMGAGSSPVLTFRQSLDNGWSWSAERYVPIGTGGQTNYDVQINRLGSTRRGLNSDRVFEISSRNNFRPILLGAEIG